MGWKQCREGKEMAKYKLEAYRGSLSAPPCDIHRPLGHVANLREAAKIARIALAVTDKDARVSAWYPSRAGGRRGYRLVKTWDADMCWPTRKEQKRREP